MECVNCLSKQARVERPQSFWDYFWAPVVLPMKCSRCLKRWRFPTILIGIEKLIELLDSEPNRKAGRGRKR